MLVLTRKLNQAIIIDERIRVILLEIDGDKIKLGIDAPRDVPIVRDELYQAVVIENMEASDLKPGDLPPMDELPLPVLAERKKKGTDI